MKRAGLAGALLAQALVVGGACSANAAGFALFEQTGRGLGSAFAGEAAAAEDATTIYYNPAGMTLLNGTQFASSGFAIIPSARFTNEGSHLNPEVGGGALRGGNGGEAGGLNLVPTFFLMYAPTPRLRLGLGASSPFGLTTKYDDGWVGRYHALSSSLETVNVNPSVAFRVTDWLSLGGGADIEYAKARLSNDLDLGSICRIFGAQQGVTPATCDALGLRPQQVDGYVKLSGDDWNAGWNVGALFSPWNSTRIGLAFRSKIHHTLGGSATFILPPQGDVLRKASGALRDTGAHASADLPERVTLAGAHQIAPRWTVLADMTWTHWSRFRELVFEFDNPKQPPIVQPENWQDSVRWALGLRWTPTRTVALRAGTAYDEKAVPDAEHRTPRIPDADRFWLSVGAGWRATDRIRVDLGYAHIFSPVGSTHNPDPVTGHILRGDFSAHADIIGIQGTLALDYPHHD
jgi:long-chain fatty acid transport protein